MSSEQVTPYAENKVHVDFFGYLDLPRDRLYRELTDAHQNIANLSIDIAFLRGEEERGVTHAREARREMEGTREAYIEKKWLIKTLLDAPDG